MIGILTVDKNIQVVKTSTSTVFVLVETYENTLFDVTLFINNESQPIGKVLAKDNKELRNGVSNAIKSFQDKVSHALPKLNEIIKEKQ